MPEHRGNPLPEAIARQIRRLRREGLSIRAIARLSGVAKSTVEKVCRVLPVPAQPKVMPPTNPVAAREGIAVDVADEPPEAETPEQWEDRLLDEFEEFDE